MENFGRTYHGSLSSCGRSLNGIYAPSTACKSGYQTHRISGAHGRLKFPKKPDILVINENQNGTTDPTVGLAQSVINPIEALLQLQEHLPKGSGPDFDRLFTITQSTELRRDQNFNHGLGSSKKLN